MIKTLPAAVLFVGLLSPLATGADWPQYRYDANRSAASPAALPETLHLAWSRELPPPRPAFPTEIRLRYDETYEPVVRGKRIFVPSMVEDTLTALDTETGGVLWRFFTEGPVRLAPLAWEDRVYCVSDDGHLYCLGAGDGRLRWKFRGYPEDRTDRRVMGNGRLIPLFPARGGPVLHDGVIYFAAGIWAGEGVFVHALDAKTGKAVWSNVDSDRIEKANMDHGVAYFAGISPQGHLAVVDGRLVVPCGAQLPALFDLKTGERETYTIGWGGRVGLAKGCAFVSGIGRYLVHGGDLYDIRKKNEEMFSAKRQNDFKHVLYLGGYTRLQIDRTNQKGMGDFRKPVLTPETLYCRDGGIVAYDMTKPTVVERAKSEVPRYRKNDKYPDKSRATFPARWRLESGSRVHIKAGNRLYCGGKGVVEAIDLPGEGGKPAIGWKAGIPGTPHRLLAADGRLFVVTKEGTLLAFAGEKPAKPVVHARPALPAPEPDAWTRKAAEILKMSGIGEGYVVMLGLGPGRLAEEIVRQSRCDVIVIEADPARAAGAREAFLRAGLYGSRISVYLGPTDGRYPLPAYLASLMLYRLEDRDDPPVRRKLVRPVRPYGGTVCIQPTPKTRDALAKPGSWPGAVVREAGNWVLVTRPGPLPGTEDWSHPGATAANTNATDDRVLKAPLARLWFDSSARWVRTPNASVVRVAGGRVIVKSAKITAIDAYTGRRLWEVSRPPSHNPGDEIVAVEDGIYLPAGRTCVVLDPATGKEVGKIALPDDVEGRWGLVRVEGDRLVGTAGEFVVCMDRRSGELVWKRRRERKLETLALGGGRVYCADYYKRPRKGQPGPDMSKVFVRALDLKTGEPVWAVAGGSGARYNAKNDLVVTERGVYRASDGSSVWKVGGTVAITPDRLLSGAADRVTAYDIYSGKKSGKEITWYRRGCTSLRASTHLLTTRYMGNASYIDLESGDIASIWNVRAACSNNLFPADGVLNIPNLSGGCTCNYQPMSQAFVPAAALE